MFCANSGTTIRFLTALATLGHGSFRLDGVERMRQRPIGDLLDSLNQLGAHVVSENGDGCPPVIVHANGLPGGAAKIRGDISSQYLSGVLMAAPAARSPVELAIDGPLVSQPYMRMTLEVMKSFGVEIETGDPLQQFESRRRKVIVRASMQSNQMRRPRVTFGQRRQLQAAKSRSKDCRQTACRATWHSSIASKKWVAKCGAIAHSITVVGRPLRGIDVDMNAISDTVQTLAVVAMFAEGPTVIRNVGHIRHKETDRMPRWRASCEN